MPRQFVTPNDPEVLRDTDSASIQAAVDLAAETGCGKVVIPRMNARTGEALWIISDTILLPSDMTVELDNAHLRFAPTSISRTAVLLSICSFSIGSCP